MLFRTLRKIVKNSNLSTKEEYITSSGSIKNIISLDRNKNEIKLSSPLAKVSDDPSKRRLITEKFTKQIEEKNQKINELELHKTELLNQLKLFYIEIIEMLKFDHNLSEDFKKILLSVDLRQHLEYYDEQMILQNIRELLKNCLDLRWNVQALERKDFREEEKDYVIMYRRLEIDLKKSLYNEEQLKFMNDVFQNKIEEFIGHQNSLFEKTRTHLLDAKEEYLKLMEFVRGKDYEIEKLANSNDKQKDLIQSLEERLLSIVVLEYKMKNLDLENQKNLDKTKKDYETSLNKFILTHKLSTSSSNKEINEVQKMKEAEKKLAEIKIKELEKNNQAIKNKLAMTIDLRNKSLQEKTQEIKNLKENLSRIKKSKYLLQEPIPKKIKFQTTIIKDNKSLENNIHYLSTKQSETPKNKYISTKQSESQNDLNVPSLKYMESVNKADQPHRSSTKKNNFFYTNQEIFD